MWLVTSTCLTMLLVVAPCKTTEKRLSHRDILPLLVVLRPARALEAVGVHASSWWVHDVTRYHTIPPNPGERSKRVASLATMWPPENEGDESDDERDANENFGHGILLVF